MSDSTTAANAVLATAIRQSLARVYQLSDDDLVARDGRMNALFRAVAAGATFTREGALAFEALSHLTLGSTLPTPPQVEG